MITVITPFQRMQNLPYLEKLYKGKVNWIVLVDEDLNLPDWVTVRKFPKPPKGITPSNWLFNEFLSTTKLEPETQYILLCDDDSVEEGFFDKIPNEDAVLVSMKRSDRIAPHIVWDDWSNKIGHWENGYDVLIASPKNMKIARVAGEQLILKGKVLKKYRYGMSPIGDGQMVLQVGQEHNITYVPDAFVYFNYFEDGRWQLFRRKPLVLFVGDYYCAANPRMGISEWEGNLAHSLDSTGLADVVTFHMDKHYLHTGIRGDEVLLERINEIEPDYIVLVLYKPLGSDPTVILEETIKSIKNIPIISIWGDLEAIEQQSLAKLVEFYCKRMIGTANKEVTESLGYTYLHVPKDSRIFNNPNKERDIDVVFSGSYGYGREERQKYMNYLLSNQIKLTHGGSEGGDHFTTEEYADRYKRAKIGLSFSRARGMNVVNARVFEVMNCGAMLLEQESPELAKLYTPYVDYIPWTDEVDLLKKVRYYLEHEDERTLIALNGQRKTEKLYSAKSFWSKIINNLNANAKL